MKQVNRELEDVMSDEWEACLITGRENFFEEFRDKNGVNVDKMALEILRLRRSKDELRAEVEWLKKQILLIEKLWMESTKRWSAMRSKIMKLL